jgi:zinc transporter ZupT
MKEYWIGVSNAIAAGMMCAASYSLFVEGCTFHDVNDTSYFSPILRTALGCILGLLFILSTKNFLDTHEENASPFGVSLSGADTRKILLIIFVMTLHSFSEGVGIGVSFGGEHGHDFGVFISASLAVHNVPEGLAVATNNGSTSIHVRTFFPAVIASGVRVCWWGHDVGSIYGIIIGGI